MPGLLGQLNQSMQQDVPALGQVSGTSPNFDPSLQVAPPSPMPDKSPMSMVPSGGGDSALHRHLRSQGIPIPPELQQTQGAAPDQGQVTIPVEDQNAGQPGVQVPASEAELIIKALGGRLGHLSKSEQHMTEAMLPKNQAQPQQ